MFLDVYSSNLNVGSGVSYACRRLSEELSDQAFDVTVHVPASHSKKAGVPYRNALPSFADKHRLRWLRDWRHEQLYLQSLKRHKDRGATIAYLWPDAPLETVKQAKSLGVPIVREMINGHVGTAQRIMHDAYARRGLDRIYVTDAHVDYERAMLALCDAVFAPSSLVAQSLIENGVPDSKIMRAGYGWNPDRIDSSTKPDLRNAGFTLLFVGSLCIRKGIDTLVQAWRQADVEGRLLLVGHIQDDLEDHFSISAADRIEHIPFTDNVAALYGQADVFVIPSLEEGAPLVTFEAAGGGLPILSTPMGCAGLVEDGRNGVVVPAENVEALAQAIRNLAQSPDLVRRLGAQAKADAAGFTWSKSAEHRAALLRARFG